MRILSRYVLVELAKVFLISLATITGMMILLGVFREAAMQNVPLGQVARLIPYILPDALRVAIPVTLLLAATSVYGRMSGSNEVVAAKALGISPMALLWPTFIAAFLLSLVTVWLNDVAVSWGRHGARQVVVDAGEEIAYSRLKAMTITAEKAELQSDRTAGVLRIFLRNSRAHVHDKKFGKLAVQLPDEYEHEITLRRATRASDASTAASWMPLRAISRETV